MHQLRHHILAIAIALHLIAVILKALPAPEGGMNREDWKNPTVKAEFASWNSMLRHVGWTGTQAELEEHLWVLAKGTMNIRNKLLEPFDLYYHYVGADQNWRLFVAPHMYPSQLHIDIMEHGEWKSVYRPFGEKEQRWQANLLENGRFRPSIFRYAWPRYKKQYTAFAVYLAKQAARDFPQATEIQVQWWNYASPSPEQVRNGTEIRGSYKNALLYHLDDFRNTDPLPSNKDASNKDTYNKDRP